MENQPSNNRIFLYLSVLATVISLASLAISIFVYFSVKGVKQVTLPSLPGQPSPTSTESVTGKLPQGVDKPLIKNGVIIGVPTGGTPPTPKVAPGGNVIPSASSDIQAEIEALKVKK